MPVLPPGSSSGLTSATYPLALPASNSPAQVKFTMRNMVGESRSPFSGTRQVFEWPAEWWEASVALPPMAEDFARGWIAWQALLRGKSGSFLLGDPSLQAARGSVAGTPMVNGGGQQGKQLLTKGFTPNATGVLLSGDWIQLGSGLTQRLYMNLLNVDADSSGHATLNLFPRLREAPADNDLLVTGYPKGVFALSGNDRDFEVGSDRIYRISFTAVEAI